jgi:hypothetical protein
MLLMATEREQAFRSGRLRTEKKGKGSVFLTCEEVEAALASDFKSASSEPSGTDSERNMSLSDNQRVQGAETGVPAEDTKAFPAPDRRDRRDASSAISDLRERTRRAARRLAGRDMVILLQNGRELPPSGAAGVMEVRIREQQSGTSSSR